MAQQKIQEADTEAPTQNFSADVARLLDIVANALYTNHDVFLRELVSNGSDACDRLRYEALQKPALIKGHPDFRIHVFKDTEARTLTVIDNGIGMDDTELAENLGTIAKSGTATLMDQMTKSEGADGLNLIGQFGVGFYAGYMVAGRIEVISRKAGDKKTWHWESDGRTGFSVREAAEDESVLLDGLSGTVIILHIKDEGSDFLLDEKINQTIKQYSDHISVPIYLGKPENHDKEDGDEDKPEALNSASALWMRPKNEIEDEQYTAFYRHISHGMDEPLMTSHWRAEGKIEFTSLLFVPTLRPWDMFDPSRRHFVKLYVRRVFISEDVETLMYPWLRFVRGVIDSEDLPLNISRESLQYNPIINKIRSAVARRILGDLNKLSQNDAPAFIAFWGQFGPVLKEGLYDAAEHRTDLFRICRFYSSHDNGDKFVSLPEYVERMKEGQDKIYYISGENVQNLKNSPQLEGFRARGIEVLFMTDTVDDFWLQQILDYEGTAFQSITKGDIDLAKFESNEKEDHTETKQDKGNSSKTDDISPLLEKLTEILDDKIDAVRISQRLTDSPVCLVAPESGIDMHMERVLKIHQKYQGESKPVLEINPKHPLILKLGDLITNGDDIDDAAWLLFDQARIIQGEPLDDPSAFARRLSDFMAKGL